MRRRIRPVLRRTLWWAAIAASAPLLAAQALAGTLTVNGSLTATNLTVTNLTAQTITLGGAPPTSTNLRLQGNQYDFTPDGTNATRRGNTLRTGYTSATTLAPATYMRALTSSVPADLALWWSFEEGGGTTLGDASGNGSSGSLVGDPLPVWTKGVTSDALSFDCAQNYIGSDQPISQTFTAATLECWFLADCVSGENPPLVGTAHDDNPVYGQGDIGSLLIFTPGDHPDMGYMIYFAVGNNWLAAPTNAFDGQYHQAAGVWDGSQMRLYYDGQLVATTNASISPVEANCYLRAGYRDTNGGCYLGGIIGETRLYDRALSSDEVAADYNTDTVGDGIPDWWRLKYFGSGTGTNELSCASCDPNQDSYSNYDEYENGTDPMAGFVVPANLLVKWTFNEGNGRALGDVSGNGHGGTLLGDPPPAWTNAVTSGALSFDGSQNYVQSDQTFDESISAFTIECWFAGSTVSGENPVIIGTAGDDFSSDYLGDIVVYDDSIAVEVQSLRTGTNLSLLDGQWHHVAGVWDGSDVRLYLDGQLVASDARAYSPFPWQTPLRLAYRNTNGGCNYGGNIGEVRIYDRALSSDEVATNYNVDTVGDGIPNWWRMKYFGSGTTTNSTSCASCNPTGDGFTNLQKYQSGLSPLVAYVINAPSMVKAGSTDNPASVTDVGSAVSYSWSIDDGTITAGDGTPNVTWTAGDPGAATLTVSLQSTDAGTSPLALNGTSQILPCSLQAVILTPPEVRVGSTNIASVPSPLTTLYSFPVSSTYLPLGLIQGKNYFVNSVTNVDTNFYGVADDAVFRMPPGGGTVTNLHQFSTSTTIIAISNGYWASMPVQGSGTDSNFYGVTYLGGLTNDTATCDALTNWYGYGSVYKLTAQGTLTTLHRFSGSPDGANPPAALVQGPDGRLYGVTESGGTPNCTDPDYCCYHGFGTVFAIATNGPPTNSLTIYAFTNGLDGAFPEAPLVQGTGADAGLYGTTADGGSGGYGYGTVFRITTNGTLTVLHSFSNSLYGAMPLAGLVQGSGGDSSNLYGTTFLGGANGYGTVFRINTNGTSFMTLHQFGGTLDGALPSAGLTVGFDGFLYGTTETRGLTDRGTVFRISSNGDTFAAVYGFTGGADGGWPDNDQDVPGRGLMQSPYDGYLYGTTMGGGANGKGTAYKFLPATYTWSINNGTIVGAMNSPSIQWTTSTTNLVTITLTVTDSPVCTQIVSTTVIPYTGAIAAGGDHSVALRSDGTLWAWGDDSDGELGDGVALLNGANTYRPFPVEMADPTVCTGQTVGNVVSLAAGGNEFTVVADANGAVWTVGDDETGEQGGAPGNYDPPPYNDHFPASPMTNLSNIVSVSAGYGHVLALRADGEVFAWGDNSSGQLGVGTTGGESTSPTNALIPTQAMIVAVAAGYQHSVALDMNGRVWTWGDNSSGQLGNGGTDSTNVPTMATISNVIAIAAGGYPSGSHTIALTADRTVWTWGYNGWHQLGRNVTQTVYDCACDPLPGLVTALGNTNMVAIAGGDAFTLAVTSNGYVYGWGDNGSGQLGTTDPGEVYSPVRATGISNAVLVSASLNAAANGHSLAMTVDGGTNHYWAWGFNNDGEVGNDGTGYREDTPAQPQFCTRCQRCIQLGTSGILTAQCNGTLYLYFNDAIGQFYDNGTNSYSVMFRAAGQTNVVATVMGANDQGTSVGTVTNGGVYYYSATGFCAYDSFPDLADADGNDPGSNRVGCSSINVTNTICPVWRCFSLVGKIQ